MEALQANVEAALYRILVLTNRGELTGDTVEAVEALEAGLVAHDALVAARKEAVL